MKKTKKVPEKIIGWAIVPWSKSKKPNSIFCDINGQYLVFKSKAEAEENNSLMDEGICQVEIIIKD